MLYFMKIDLEISRNCWYHENLRESETLISEGKGENEFGK